MRNQYSRDLQRNVCGYTSAFRFHPPHYGFQGAPAEPQLSIVDQALGFVDKAQRKADRLEKAVTWLSFAAGINMAIGAVLLWKSRDR